MGMKSNRQMTSGRQCVSLDLCNTVIGLASDCKVLVLCMHNDRGSTMHTQLSCSIRTTWLTCMCDHCSANVIDSVAMVMQDRDHLKFVCKLKDYVPDREHLLDKIPGALVQAGLTIEEAELTDAEKYLEKDYFKNTKLVELMTGEQKTCDVHTATGSIAPGIQRTVNPPGSQN